MSVEVSCTAEGAVAGRRTAQSTRILVISMAASAERRAAFAARAKDSPVPWEFFDARGELAPGLTYREAEVRRIFGRPLTTPELGVYSSHYTLWRRLLDDDVKQYLILEDDVIADWKMLGLIAGTDFGENGVDFLRLYHSRPGRFRYVRSSYLTRTSHLIQITDLVYGAHGYVITRAAAERLIQRGSNIARPVDAFLGRFWEHGIPNLCLFPFPLVEELGTSTIGNERFNFGKRRLRIRVRRKLWRAWDAMKRRMWLARGTPNVKAIGDPEKFWR